MSSGPGNAYGDTANPKNQGRVDVIILATGASEVQRQLGWWGRGIVIDNLTNQWLFVREASAYCPPYVSGRSIPISGSQKISVSFATPVGFTQQPIVAGQTAYIRITEQLASSAPGVPVAPGQTRWNITHSPATGVQASVTKAAVVGTIHVADLGYFKGAGTAAPAAGTNARVSIIDGPSGGGTFLFTTLVIMQAVIGDRDTVIAGPLLGAKAVVSDPMTIEFAVGMANVAEVVNLIGYDA